jgi:hypothetical protein
MLPFGFFLFCKTTSVYAIPGTSHALISEPSLDASRQDSLRETVIHNTVSQSDEELLHTAPDSGSLSPPSSLPANPHCFVVDTDSHMFLVDSGANAVIVNDVTLLTNFHSSTGGVKGIGGLTIALKGSGRCAVPLHFDDGSTYTVTMPAVYVPTSPYNIVPPQLMVKELKSQGCGATSELDDQLFVLHLVPTQHRHDQLHVIKNPTPFTKIMTVPVDRRNLFTMWTNPGYHSFFAQASHFNPEYSAFAGTTHIIPADESAPVDESVPTTTPVAPITSEPTTHTIPFQPADFEPIPSIAVELDFDLPAAPTLPAEDPNVAIVRRKQHRLAVLHEKFGHLSFPILQMMAKAGLIPGELANVDPPTCPGCAYGKAHRRPWRGKSIKNQDRRTLRIATAPGQVISVDQLVSPTAGFVPTHRGRPSLMRYIGATVFVDHFSDFTYVHLMTEMDAAATVAAKQAFERLLRSHGVTVHHYHADNGLFDTKLFKSAIATASQTLSFCGVNAHHQNGKAENRIKTVTEGARTALLHAAHRWPTAVNASLWPAALKNYVNLRNSLPTEYIPQKKVGKRVIRAQYHSSPLSKLSGTEVEPNLDHFHPFGSPVYVLHNSLQSHHSHNKWTDRSRVGIFLSHSPHHASSVPLVLNTQTGLVSPQFHCIYDDAFDTSKRDTQFESQWQRKAKLQSYADLLIGSRHTVSPTTNVPLPASTAAPFTPAPRFVTPWEYNEIPASSEGAAVVPDSSEGDAVDSSEGAVIIETTASPDLPIPLPLPHRPTGPTYTRSGRRVTPNRFYFNNSHANTAYLDTFSPGVTSADNPTSLLQPDCENVTEPHPLALLATYVIALVSSASDPDTMTFAEAMQAPDRDEFVKAMHKELADHIGRKHWKIVPLKSIQYPKRAIPMVWAMKRKRNPIGEIIKWKARLCAGGHRSIENIDYWSTYSPVVSWSTVRLMIVFALLNDWHMESIDFVLAYPQAPVKTDIYMTPPRVPPNFIIPDLPSFSDRLTKVYKLIKNLYGLKDAGKTWADYLKKGLLERGWKSSEIDSCLFTKNGIVLVLYVDDAILLSPYKSLIDSEIRSLQRDYDLTDDGELQDYLGTRFTKHPNGSIELTQPRMVQRILDMVGLGSTDERVKMHDTPACDRHLLDQDPDGLSRVSGWNYRSVVGSLSYLQAMIRPDLTMAVQQAARFCNDPLKQHEEAVKRICRYLLKTKDKGIVFKPDKSKGLECYVDADWAGSWQHRSSHDPLSARSRTGYVILYAGCPIIWASKMQTLVALSTTEAEYIALSSALREVIAVINLMNELKNRGFHLSTATPTVICKTFEDNQSCIEIATNHRTRPRTKHLSVRLHHFRSHILNKTISIEHVSTKKQVADIFTKPLPRDQFRILRVPLMGWHHLAARE